VTGSVRRVLGTLVATCVLSAIPAAFLPVVAEASADQSSGCDSSNLTQPFLQWGDNSYYELAPGGDFESGLGGWSFSGGAGPVNGSDTFGASGAAGSSSLSVPAGGVALSPEFCVDANSPDFRFFTRTDTPGTRLIASVVYTTPSGHTVAIPVGQVRPSASWQPTSPMATLSVLAGAFGNGTANVSLQFTASGQGTAQVDDVFIDPSGRCC
jgi:hypothetical protein